MSIHTETVANSTHENSLFNINCARSQMYKILSMGFLYPEEKTINFFANEINSIIDLIGDNLPFNIHDSLAILSQEAAKIRVSDLQDIQSEYVRLFDYKPKCYITEATYREHKALGNNTLDVNCFYRQAGLKVDVLEFPDHLAVELEFMHYLSYHATQAHEPTDTMENLATQFSFLEQHLITWGPALCLSIQAETKHRFYNALANAARKFIDLDHKFLEELSGATEMH